MINRTMCTGPRRQRGQHDAVVQKLKTTDSRNEVTHDYLVTLTVSGDEVI